MMKYLFGPDSQPMAGDGYGLVTRPTPVAFRPVDYKTPVEAKKSPLEPERSQPSHNAIVNRRVSNGTPLPPSVGSHAPRCSIITNMSTSSPIMPSPSVGKPLQPEITSPKPDSDPIERTPWQDYEIPDELGIVRENAPKEVQDIIQESIDERRAIRASILHAQAIVVQTRIETSRARRKTNERVVAESSSYISAKSTPASDSDTRSGSSLSVESTTTVESDLGLEHGLGLGLDLLRIPKPFASPTLYSSSESLRSQRSQQSLRSESGPSSNPKPATAPATPSMAAIESKLRESKVRTTKSRKLFKLLPTRTTKTPTIKTSTGSAFSFHRNEPKSYECTSCFDDIPRKSAVNGLPCNHAYCAPCFSQLVSTAIHSEDTFPPKCCLQEISKTLLRAHLAPKELDIYDQKALEYAVPIANRYYCVHGPCARWIDTRHAKRTNGVLSCSYCHHTVCTVCRGPSHPANQDCPQDYGLSSTLEHADLEGWQRCYNCRTLVERNQGCRHITCKCRAEFCYTCGRRWGTCACTEADQLQRDRERAVRVAQRDVDAHNEEEEVRAAIAAVEAAERQIQEEREAEEARLAAEAADLARQEAQRIARVTAHFEHLRKVLESTRIQQRTALQSRHEADDRALKAAERRRSVLVATREQDILAEKKRLIKEGEATVADLQRKHAMTMMETIARHRNDQDELLAADVSDHVRRDPYDATRQAEALRSAMLEALIAVQDMECVTLKEQQKREVAKWKARAEQAVKGHDAKMMMLKVKLEEAEQARGVVEEARRREWSDWRWFESLFEERMGMLGEDEGKVVRSGGDVPLAATTETGAAAAGGGGGGGGGKRAVSAGTGRRRPVPLMDEEPRVEVAKEVAYGRLRISEGDLGEYVRLRGWGSPQQL